MRPMIAAVMLVLMSAAMPRPAAAQQCTSLGTATDRRAEALRAVRLVASAAVSIVPPPSARARSGTTYPSWAAVANLPMVVGWRGEGGPTGELARKIRWGSAEPLPGWRIHWVADATGFAFSLTDTRDPCGFSYSADERNVITQGLAVDRDAKLFPVESR